MSSCYIIVNHGALLKFHCYLEGETAQVSGPFGTGLFLSVVIAFCSNFPNTLSYKGRVRGLVTDSNERLCIDEV